MSEAKNLKGEWFTLTEEEDKYIRELERLSKMNPGHIELMANGILSVRINGRWYDDNMDEFVNTRIRCEDGDGSN